LPQNLTPVTANRGPSEKLELNPGFILEFFRNRVFPQKSPKKLPKWIGELR